MLAPMDEVAQGRQAWERLRHHARRDWTLWLAVARAVAIGRAASLAAAECKTPYGKRYTKAMAAWLAENQLDGIGQQVRWRLLQCLDHLAEIEPWLASLDPERRNRLNHPDSVWLRFSHRQEPARTPSLRHAAGCRPKPANASAGTARAGRAVHWPADHIRRAATAMRESRSSDLFVLARKALEAAVRSEGDLLQLLERPAPSARPAATPLHA